MAKIPQTRSASGSKAKYDVIPNDVYEARIVRFIGLGVQEQPEYQGQKKEPAFKCAIQFELIGVDATGTDGEGKPIEAGRPSCVFKDFYLFPRAKRGGVFDLCNILEPGIEKVPEDLDWFISKLGEPLMVEVGSYKTGAGDLRNKVVGISPMSSRAKAKLDPARADLVGFDPYVDSPEMMGQYSKLFKFQREILAEAHDREVIPFAGKEPMSTAPEGSDGKPAPAAQAAAPRTAEPNVAQDFDDDIPF